MTYKQACFWKSTRRSNYPIIYTDWEWQVDVDNEDDDDDDKIQDTLDYLFPPCGTQQQVGDVLPLPVNLKSESCDLTRLAAENTGNHRVSGGLLDLSGLDCYMSTHSDFNTVASNQP